MSSDMKLIMESFNTYLGESDKGGALGNWIAAVTQNKEEAEEELNESIIADLFQIMTDGVAYSGLAELITGILAGIAKKKRQKLADHFKYEDTFPYEALAAFFTEVRRGVQTFGIYTALKRLFKGQSDKLGKWVDALTLIIALLALVNDGILQDIVMKIKGKGGLVGVIKSVFSALTEVTKNFGAWINNLIKALSGAIDTKDGIKLGIKSMKALFKGVVITAKATGKAMDKAVDIGADLLMKEKNLTRTS